VGIWLLSRTVRRALDASYSASTVRGLDQRRRQALVHEVQRYAVGRRLECACRRRGVAMTRLGADVVRRMVAKHGCTGLHRVERIDDGGQFVVVDDHRIGRRAGGVAALGDDRGHRLADETHASIRQRAAFRRGQRLAVGPLETRRVGDRPDASTQQVGAGEYRHHAGHLPPASQSMAAMRACAYGERRNARCTVPAGEKSSLNCPCPATSAGSSTRRTSCPLPKRPPSNGRLTGPLRRPSPGPPAPPRRRC
jgi:hypothetical protein